MTESKNNINIIGKLVSMDIKEGTTKAGKPYERANIVVRVEHQYSGKDEVSEVEVEFFASPYTSKNQPNPAYQQFQTFKNCRSIQDVGYEQADIVRIPCELQENMYYSTQRSQVVTDWRLRTSFPAKAAANSKQTAAFSVDAYIFDIHDEYDREGEITGRLVVKAGVIGWGGSLSLMDFIVEKPEYVNFVNANWNVNDTVRIDGRVRETTSAVAAPKLSGWGEETPTFGGKAFVKELIVINGSEEAYEDGFDEDLIKKAFNERKAKMDELATGDTIKTTTTAATTQKKRNKYDWE